MKAQTSILFFFFETALDHMIAWAVNIKPFLIQRTVQQKASLVWYRIVAIPASVVVMLGKHRASQNKERLAAGSRWKPNGLVFASTIGTPLDERNVRREFFALLKAAKLPVMRLHDLRHSYAPILLAAGEHPKVVQETLGHASVQLTLDTYSHLLPNMGLKERAAARLDALLTAPQPFTEAVSENPRPKPRPE